ncbi:MAG TPA: translation initiation factor IF-3, partial [Chitinophagales bacterium]|nr:translation initiation factor IF-3 [Chitinophagales bacterium]
MIPKRRPFIPKKKETEHRLNRDIRVPEVRLVGEEIEPGVYPIEEALRLAKEQ